MSHCTTNSKHNRIDKEKFKHHCLSVGIGDLWFDACMIKNEVNKMFNRISIKARLFTTVSWRQEQWLAWEMLSYYLFNVWMKVTRMLNTLERITSTSPAAEDTPGGTDYCIHLKWRKYHHLLIYKGCLLKISLCAFAGTCESPIENEQETDEFPGTPTNLPTHFYWFAMDNILWLGLTTVVSSSEFWV